MEEEEREMYREPFCKNVDQRLDASVCPKCAGETGKCDGEFRRRTHGGRTWESLDGVFSYTKPAQPRPRARQEEGFGESIRYSPVQLIVRRATSSKTGHPSVLDMCDIAKMTYSSPTECSEVMEILRKRMIDNGKE